MLFSSGLVPAEDAPDIVANTFLAGITEEQVDDVGYGFLKHSHCAFLFISSPRLNNSSAQWYKYSALSNQWPPCLDCPKCKRESRGWFPRIEAVWIATVHVPSSERWDRYTVYPRPSRGRESRGRPWNENGTHTNSLKPLRSINTYFRK